MNKVVFFVLFFPIFALKTMSYKGGKLSQYGLSVNQDSTFKGISFQCPFTHETNQFSNLEITTYTRLQRWVANTDLYKIEIYYAPDKLWGYKNKKMLSQDEANKAFDLLIATCEFASGPYKDFLVSNNLLESPLITIVQAHKG